VSAGLKIEIPEKCQFLNEPHRYKILHGGRGAGRSWSVAQVLLAQGVSRPLRVVCGREIQNSIRQSVHALLRDRVAALGLGRFYDVQNEVIRGLNGTEFTFHGLRYNVENIKSLEGADRVWVEEGTNVSKDTWEKLIPTVRKDDSEIWVTFNEELETDETYIRFVAKAPASAKVVKLTYRDNPWFPQVLRDEVEELRARDPDAYLHIWEGNCRQFLDGAIYANELRKAQADNRITSVPYDRSKAVHVFTDLGWRDYTSLWFVQKVGLEYRVIDSYQDRHKPWHHYLEVIQGRGYVIDTIWLPHDGASKQLGTGKSIEELTRAAGKTVRIVPSESVETGINAVRTLFPACWFDQANCADGLNALRRYSYQKNSRGQYLNEPLHDDSSDFADAFRMFAVGFKEFRPAIEQAERVKERLRRKATLMFPVGSSGNWMR
jgi:phage terminase large subunit